MSHQVVIDYEQIGIQCESICEVAESRLKELEKLLEQAEKTSSKLMTDEAKNLANAIREEKLALEQSINDVRQRANQDAKKGKVNIDIDYMRFDTRENTVNLAKNLQNQANIISSDRIMQFEELLNRILGDKLAKANKELAARANGVIIINDEIQTLLDKIEDNVLRQFVYIAYLENPKLTDGDLINAGKHLMNGTYESRVEEEKARIKAELEAAKIDKTTIDRVMSEASGTAQEQIQTLQNAATNEIIGEKVRKKSLKIIMQAIEARGFVVDKKNIRILRDTNEVVLVALKASGEKAEFRVFLDGRFIYDFHGYQGQACQKDIEPFIQDLEDVYGIHIKSQQEIWSNPDKVSTMKYQTFNTNKNKR